MMTRKDSLRTMILGTYSPTSEIGGRVIWTGGVSPSIMAGTHGYGFGCILTYEDDVYEKALIETDQC